MGRVADLTLFASVLELFPITYSQVNRNRCALQDVDSGIGYAPF